MHVTLALANGEAVAADMHAPPSVMRAPLSDMHARLADIMCASLARMRHLPSGRAMLHALGGSPPACPGFSPLAFASAPLFDLHTHVRRQRRDGSTQASALRVPLVSVLGMHFLSLIWHEQDRHRPPLPGPQDMHSLPLPFQQDIHSPLRVLWTCAAFPSPCHQDMRSLQHHQRTCAAPPPLGHAQPMPDEVLGDAFPCAARQLPLLPQCPPALMFFVDAIRGGACVENLGLLSLDIEGSQTHVGLRHRTSSLTLLAMLSLVRHSPFLSIPPSRSKKTMLRPTHRHPAPTTTHALVPHPR
eukprot:227833-Chlamydomonas_euryale.AAC.5